MDYSNRDYEQTEFSKSLLAGVFAGITATCLSLVYNFVFRYYTGFSLSAIINVSTIIFALILLVTVSGLIFYLFHHYFKKGTIIFQLVTIMVTLALFMLIMQVQRSQDIVIATEFRELLMGVMGITGLCVLIVVPFLYKHEYV